MSTPYTVTRLVRWRVKDWVSCLYACRFPLEDDCDKFSSPHPKLVGETTAEISRRAEKRSRRPEGGTKSTPPAEKKKLEGREAGNEKDEEEESSSSSSWPAVEEEDYIVFCFTDDGGVQLIPNPKSKNALNGAILRKENEREKTTSLVEPTSLWIEEMEETQSKSCRESTARWSGSTSSSSSFAFPM